MGIGETLSLRTVQLEGVEVMVAILRLLCHTVVQAGVVAMVGLTLGIRCMVQAVLGESAVLVVKAAAAVSSMLAVGMEGMEGMEGMVALA